jgi:hypothetical protein
MTTWKDIRAMGVALGHAVATRMSDEDPTSIGDFIDRARTAQIEEDMENKKGGLPTLCSQPVSWEDGCLHYRLGSWIVAKSGNGSIWWLDCPLLQKHGIIKSGSPERTMWEDRGLIEALENHYGVTLTPEHKKAIENGGPAMVVDVLADILPEDHYSGQAYRRLSDLLI